MFGHTGVLLDAPNHGYSYIDFGGIKFRIDCSINFPRLILNAWEEYLKNRRSYLVIDAGGFMYTIRLKYRSSVSLKLHVDENHKILPRQKMKFENITPEDFFLGVVVDMKNNYVQWDHWYNSVSGIYHDKTAMINEISNIEKQIRHWS